MHAAMDTSYGSKYDEDIENGNFELTLFFVQKQQGFFKLFPMV